MQDLCEFSKLFAMFFNLVQAVKSHPGPSTLMKKYLQVAKEILEMDVMTTAEQQDQTGLQWGIENLRQLMIAMVDELDLIRWGKDVLAIKYQDLKNVVGGRTDIKVGKTLEGQEIVIKLMKGKGIERHFIREMNFLKLTKGLPYLCQFQDFLWLRDGPVIVMEKYDGDLQKIIKSISLKNRWALLPTLFEQLTTGLAMLHQIGIYHSDIKPSNIFFRYTDTLTFYLSDFDLAHPTACGTGDRIIDTQNGTREFLPPVMEKRTKKSDYYVLGKTLAAFLGIDDPNKRNLAAKIRTAATQEFVTISQRKVANLIASLIEQPPCEREIPTSKLSFTTVWKPCYQRWENLEDQVERMIDLIRPFVHTVYDFVVVFDVMARIDIAAFEMPLPKIVSEIVNIWKASIYSQIWVPTIKKAQNLKSFFEAFDYVLYHCGQSYADRYLDQEIKLGNFLQEFQARIADGDAMGYEFLIINGLN